MPPSFSGLIAVPSLKHNHTPSENIGCDSQALCVDCGEAEIIDELESSGTKWSSRRIANRIPTVGKKYEIVATPTLTRDKVFQLSGISTL